MRLTQSQFAERVNLSEDSIGKIERGVTVPRIETLYKIAQNLKVPIENLISPLNENSCQKYPDELASFIDYLKTHSPDDIKFIHKLAVYILERKKKRSILLLPDLINKTLCSLKGIFDHMCIVYINVNGQQAVEKTLLKSFCRH